MKTYSVHVPTAQGNRLVDVQADGFVASYGILNFYDKSIGTKPNIIIAQFKTWDYVVESKNFSEFKEGVIK